MAAESLAIIKQMCDTVEHRHKLCQMQIYFVN